MPYRGRITFICKLYLNRVTSARGFTDPYSSDALGSSTLECRVYTKQLIGTDNLIGETRDTIESLLTERAAGGQYNPFSNIFANYHILSVITRELKKPNTHENQRSTKSIIEFTIIAVSKASDAAGLNIEDAVAQAQDAIDGMQPAPSSLGRVQGAIDTSTTVIDNIHSMSNIWNPLLQKVKLFSDIVGTIAEVRHGN
jgi:hypothetical protein